MSWSRHVALLIFFFVLATIGNGCRRRAATPASAPLTATEVRSARRAFDGSPPVIPHQAFGSACVTCHTETGKPVPNLAYAPANPHGDVGSLRNCRQCHLFQQDQQLFADNEFQPLTVSLHRGDRLFPGAPPTIPHTLSMRKNCLACHAGPSARPEIHCTHPERSNCSQCHVAQVDHLQEVAFTEAK